MNDSSPTRAFPTHAATFGDLIKAGKFPKPVKTSGTSRSRNLWVEQEIDDHIRALITERDGVALIVSIPIKEAI